MTLDEAITDLSQRIKHASPEAVLKIQRRSSESASIRAYAPVSDEEAVKAATQELTLKLLIDDGIDVQVLVYDIATSLPKEEQ